MFVCLFVCVFVCLCVCSFGSNLSSRSLERFNLFRDKYRQKLSHLSCPAEDIEKL